MGNRAGSGGAVVVTSVLVLTCVLVLPLASLLLDLYWLEAARTRRRITAIAQPPEDDPAPTARPSFTATQGDLSWRWPAPTEPPAAPPGSPSDAALLTLARR